MILKKSLKKKKNHIHNANKYKNIKITLKSREE